MLKCLPYWVAGPCKHIIQTLALLHLSFSVSRCVIPCQQFSPASPLYWWMEEPTPVVVTLMSNTGMFFILCYLVVALCTGGIVATYLQMMLTVGSTDLILRKRKGHENVLEFKKTRLWYRLAQNCAPYLLAPTVTKFPELFAASQFHYSFFSAAECFRHATRICSNFSAWVCEKLQFIVMALVGFLKVRNFYLKRWTWSVFLILKYLISRENYLKSLLCLWLWICAKPLEFLQFHGLPTSEFQKYFNSNFGKFVY